MKQATPGARSNTSGASQLRCAIVKHVDLLDFRPALSPWRAAGVNEIDRGGLGGWG